MQKEESDHLKIDVKEDAIDSLSTDQMMMGMTGGQSNIPNDSTQNSNDCPVMGNSTSGSGEQEAGFDFQDQF